MSVLEDSIELNRLYESYIEFLGEELSALAVAASNRGWVCTCYEEGEIRRKVIQALRDRIKEQL